MVTQAGSIDIAAWASKTTIHDPHAAPGPRARRARRLRHDQALAAREAREARDGGRADRSPRHAPRPSARHPRRRRRCLRRRRGWVRLQLSLAALLLIAGCGCAGRARETHVRLDTM